jgi:hypothetical protein
VKKPAREPQLVDEDDDTGRLGHGDDLSADAQGLSSIEDSADESVGELADEGQAFEAEAIDGVEDAADHPEQPVRTHESGTVIPPRDKD